MRSVLITISLTLLASCSKDARIGETQSVTKNEFMRVTQTDDFSQTRSLFYDDNQNIYVAGRFNGTISFKAEVSNDTFTAPGTDAVYITKLDKDGAYEWTRILGDSGTSYARPKDIRVDSLGNIIILGDFTGTLDTNPGPGSQTLTSNGSQDIFLVKLDQNGDFITSFNIGNTGYDESESLEIDSSDNIYYAGTIHGKSTDTDFDPTVGSDNLAAPGGFNSYDVFVTKINSDNSYAWTYYVGSSGTEWTGAVDVDNTGNVYFSAKYSGTIDLDNSGGTVNHTSVGSHDIFILKISSTGNYLDSISIGGDQSESVYDIDVDTSGDIIVTGSHQSTNFEFDPGAGSQTSGTNGDIDIYLAKYDSSLDLIWAHSIGSDQSDRAHALDVGDDGTVYLAGYFSGTMDADPGTNNYSIGPHTNGVADTLILKLNSSGDYLNSYHLGSSGSDQIYDLKLVGEEVAVVGGFRSPAFPSGVYTTESETLTGNENGFILKFED